MEPLVHHVQGAYYVKGFGKHGPLHNPHSYGYFQPVLHHGYVGDSLTGGFVLYQGGAFPEQFNNSCIAPNTRHSAMRWSTIEARGSTFATRAAGDFITSTHNWFRPVESTVGPDGALYVADWYDYNIAHSSPQNHGQWYMPSRFDGRIFRIAPPEVKPVPSFSIDLTKLDSTALLELLEHKNAWYARKAQRLLVTREDNHLADKLKQLALQSESQTLALQGLWILSQRGEMTESLALELLASPHEYVRAWTIRLHGDSNELYPSFHEACLELAENDPSPIVRSQLACTAKRIPGEQTLALISRLWNHEEDLEDPFIPLLIWWALEDKSISDMSEVTNLFTEESIWQRPLVKSTIIERLGRRYTAEQSEDAYAALATLLDHAPDQESEELLILGMTEALTGRQLKSVPLVLAPALKALIDENPTAPRVVQLALRFGLSEAEPIGLELLQQGKLSVAEQVELITCLGQTGSSAVISPLLEELETTESEAIKLSLLEALGRFDAPQIGEHLLAQLSVNSGKLREQTITLLCSRLAWSSQLLQSIETKQVPSSEVTLDQVRQLLVHQDPDFQERVKQIWGTIQPATAQEKQGRIKAILKILSQADGDSTNGQLLFKKNCATCHKLHGEGNSIGPDLTGAERKDQRKLLENVVDPSAMIRAQYISYTVITTEGRVLTGLLADSNENTVTLVDKQNNRTVLNRDEIDEMEESKLSLMPEKILEPLSNQDLRDLFAYLQAN
ncbi:MAG: c-type cytochrome [Planctomycetaceae bacterium]